MAIEFIEPQGAQDATIYLALVDGSSNLVTGLAAADLSAHYLRPLDASPTEITLTDLTNPDDAHTNGGFIEVDSTNMPGLYRLDLPDGAVARGENYVILTVSGDAIAQVYGLLSLDPMPSIVQGAVSDSSPAADSFDTDLSETQDDQYNDAFCLFTNGPNTGAVEKVTDYDGANKTLTTNAFPQAPNDGDNFVLVNR